MKKHFCETLWPLFFHCDDFEPFASAYYEFLQSNAAGNLITATFLAAVQACGGKYRKLYNKRPS